ncbi:MAG: hypothetical protein ACI8XO_003445 [Verrucomicrobiales bacterium]|jgi:hypothetical protein
MSRIKFHHSLRALLLFFFAGSAVVIAEEGWNPDTEFPALSGAEATYNDQQIEDVLNFIGERWHKWRKPIPASKIGEGRREFADRITPWTHEELSELAKKGGDK